MAAEYKYGVYGHDVKLSCSLSLVRPSVIVCVPSMSCVTTEGLSALMPGGSFSFVGRYMAKDAATLCCSAKAKIFPIRDQQARA